MYIGVDIVDIVVEVVARAGWEAFFCFCDKLVIVAFDEYLDCFGAR